MGNINIGGMTDIARVARFRPARISAVGRVIIVGTVKRNHRSF